MPSGASSHIPTSSRAGALDRVKAASPLSPVVVFPTAPFEMFRKLLIQSILLSELSKT